MPQSPRSHRGRFSAKRKREAVLRLLRGEDLDVVSREIGVRGETLAQWREVFLEGGLASLTKNKRDDRDTQITNLQRKLGAITMDNELLYEKIHKMEAGVPLARRWLKK